MHSTEAIFSELKTRKTLSILSSSHSTAKKMQQTGELNTITTTTKHSSSTENQPLRDKHVRDLMVDKRRLVEVPYTASLAHMMNALVANRVVAAPVAAPPGHWIGAGGSMIMESDKQTGVARKHYIGMVTMLDILAHIAGDDDKMDGSDGSDLDQKMAVPVSSIIGHCLEGLSLWTLNPNTGMIDCMEVFSKGIHRALVPVDSHMENMAGVELIESATSYRMLTQMDMVRFLKEHASEIGGIISRTISELGAVTENVFAITHRTKVIEAIKCMRAAMLNAVPIVRIVTDAPEQEYHKQLINGRGRKLIGTFSATDLRGCHLATLQSWLPLSALDFTESVSNSPLYAASDLPRELVSCLPESSFAEVIDKVVTKHVHRVWVVDRHGLLVGLVSVTDIIRVLRLSLLSEEPR